MALMGFLQVLQFPSDCQHHAIGGLVTLNRIPIKGVFQLHTQYSWDRPWIQRHPDQDKDEWMNVRNVLI